MKQWSPLPGFARCIFFHQLAHRILKNIERIFPVTGCNLCHAKGPSLNTGEKVIKLQITLQCNSPAVWFFGDNIAILLKAQSGVLCL